MKIILINVWHDRSYKNKIGGPVKVIELAENLNKMGHDVLLIVPKIGFPEKQTNLPLKQVPVIDLPILRPLLYCLINLFCLMSLTSKNKPDLIYIRYMADFLPALYARIRSIPCIIEVNDEIHFKNNLKKRVVSVLGSINLKLSNRLIALTEGIKRNLIKKSYVDSNKIDVSSSATNTKIFYPRNKTACRKRFGFNKEDHIIGFAGTCIYNYGVDILIKASAEILKIFSNTLFLIVGDGPAKTEWESEVEKCGLLRHFVFTGQVPREIAAEYICAMDVCVAPYHADRGQTSPVKLFDYLSCARPVIASAITSLRDLNGVFPGLTLITPDDPAALSLHLKELVSNIEQYEQAAMLSKNIIFEDYSWENVARQVERTYTKIVT